MKWLIGLFLLTGLLGQVTLSEEDAINLTKNIQDLQAKTDSLNKIVILQNDLIFTYKATISQDDTTKKYLNETIESLKKENNLLEKKTKLVKPSWYENKWLYFTYGAILSYAITSTINSITNIL
jgi:hypothetical protein|tara:strand:+ start:294 stop:665 length:372 start_codon:yes stop_codon:yes gene_type:complete